MSGLIYIWFDRSQGGGASGLESLRHAVYCDGRIRFLVFTKRSDALQMRRILILGLLVSLFG